MESISNTPHPTMAHPPQPIAFFVLLEQKLVSFCGDSKSRKCSKDTREDIAYWSTRGMKYHSVSHSVPPTVDDDWIQFRKFATKLQFFDKEALQDPRVPHTDENYITYVIGDNPAYKATGHKILLSSRDRMDGSRATAKEQREHGDGLKFFAKAFQEIGDAFQYALRKEGWLLVDPCTGKILKYHNHREASSTPVVELPPSRSVRLSTPEVPSPCPQKTVKIRRNPVPLPTQSTDWTVELSSAPPPRTLYRSNTTPQYNEIDSLPSQAAARRKNTLQRQGAIVRRNTTVSRYCRYPPVEPRPRFSWYGYPTEEQVGLVPAISPPSLDAMLERDFVAVNRMGSHRTLTGH